MCRVVAYDLRQRRCGSHFDRILRLNINRTRRQDVPHGVPHLTGVALVHFKNNAARGGHVACGGLDVLCNHPPSNGRALQYTEATKDLSLRLSDDKSWHSGRPVVLN